MDIMGTAVAGFGGVGGDLPSPAKSAGSGNASATAIFLHHTHMHIPAFCRFCCADVGYHMFSCGLLYLSAGGVVNVGWGVVSFWFALRCEGDGAGILFRLWRFSHLLCLAVKISQAKTYRRRCKNCLHTG